AALVGLMMLPPIPDTPEDARPWFRRLRDLRDQWLAAGVPPSMLGELSIGMSGDFEVAIEEGSTMGRVGTAIFGSRHVEPCGPGTAYDCNSPSDRVAGPPDQHHAGRHAAGALCQRVAWFRQGRRGDVSAGGRGRLRSSPARE